MKLAYIVDNYRAIHKHRVAVLRQRFGHDNVVVGEWFQSTLVYHWENKTNDKTEDDCCSFSNYVRKSERWSMIFGSIFINANRFLRENKVEVCFGFGYWPPPAIAVLAACLINNIPCILMGDSHFLSSKADRIGQFVKRAVVKRFKAAFVGGPSQVSYYENLGIPKGRVFYGYDIIDNEFFNSCANITKINAEETRKRLGLPPTYFLNLGRMVKKKNLKTLVTAYAIARKSGKLGADLVFLGTGECEEELKSHALALGLAVRETFIKADDKMAPVYFYRNQASDDLPAFYALAEAFVLPSQNEEWGLVVNEAMACGNPVIVSSVCGCAADLVHHGINGFQFSYNDAEELAKRMIEIDSQPDLARKMGQASLEIIDRWDSNFFLKNAEQAIAAAYSNR